MEVPLGVTVLEAEIRAGLEPDAPCGGQGSCGKCPGEGKWKSCAGLSDQGGRGLPGGDSGKEEKRKNSQ